jgi:hypothetical protein
MIVSSRVIFRLVSDWVNVIINLKSVSRMLKIGRKAEA